MIIAVILAVLAVLSTVVGVWDKLTSKISKALILATILIAIAAGSQIIQVIQKKQQLGTIEEQQRIIEDANLLNNSNLIEIDEASGGATRGNLAYLVDDSEPKIFVYRYGSKYEYEHYMAKPLDIIDYRSCNERRVWGGVCKEGTSTTLDRKMINDLEGAAIDRDGNLYLTTSHSYPKDAYTKDKDPQEPDPARSVFLETSLEGHVLNATKKLWGIIRELFRNKLGGIAKTAVPEYVNEGGKLEIMQIEGLAIDTKNRIYLGFRTPLVDDQFALVLRTRADQIFTDNPEFESFLLNLTGPDGSKYGIVSLEYDAQNNRIIILGNSPEHLGKSPEHSATLPPVIWSWEVSDDPNKIQRTEIFNGEIFSLKPTPGSRPAKPEVLLIPEPDRFHLFFDAQGTGGQLDLIREGMNVRRVRKG